MALFQHGRTLFERHIQLPAGTAQPVWRLEDLRQTLLTTPINVELPVPNTSRFLRHPRCKISNLGELGLLVRDRRLATLLKYYPEAETVIDQAEIRAELTSYRRVRVQVMELVHTLEHAVWIAVGSAIGNDIAEGDRAVFGKDQPRHGKLLYQLQECWRTQPNAEFTAYADVFGADRFYHARLIRNAAAHNEYPDARLFREVVEAIAAEPVPKNPDMRRHVAERLYEALDRIYKPWLAFLNEVAEKQCNV
jgi:hypothetical protein